VQSAEAPGDLLGSGRGSTWTLNGAELVKHLKARSSVLVAIAWTVLPIPRVVDI
jgi:hypothetical protein